MATEASKFVQKIDEEQLTPSITIDNAERDGWLQLRGLLDYVEQHENQIQAYAEGTRADPVSSIEVAKRVLYLIRSFNRFAFYFYEAFTKSIREESNNPLLSYHHNQALQKLYHEWEAVYELIHAINDPSVKVLEALVSLSAPNAKWFQDFERLRLQEINENKADALTLDYEQFLPNKPGLWHPDEWPEQFNLDTMQLDLIIKGEDAFSEGDPLTPKRFYDLYKDQESVRDALPEIDGIKLENAAAKWSNYSKSLAMSNDQQADQPAFIPYYSSIYSATHFRYATQIFALSIPTQKLGVPWEWGVIWHETASYVIRLFEKQNPEFWNVLASSVATQWYEDYFDASNSIPWEKISISGWLEELMEDAYTILTLGPVTYDVLKRVLLQHYKNDLELRDVRHPPVRLRLDMAKAILIAANTWEERPGELIDEDGHINKLEDIAEKLKSALEPYLRHKYDKKKVVHALQSIHPQRTVNESVRDTAGNVSLDTHKPEHLVSAMQSLYDSFESSADIVKATEGVRKRLEEWLAQQSFQDTQLDLPNEEFFRKLLAEKDWNELLDMPAHDTDGATPFRHASHSGSIILYWNAHGMRHSVYHSTHNHS